MIQLSKGEILLIYICGWVQSFHTQMCRILLNTTNPGKKKFPEC